jgi:hypothetical protein
MHCLCEYKTSSIEKEDENSIQLIVLDGNGTLYWRQFQVTIFYSDPQNKCLIF